MPEILLRYWKLELLVLLSVLNILFINLWRHEVKTYATYRTEVSRIAAEQEKHTEAVVANQERITQETANGWKAAVDYLHTHPVGLLPRACAGELPALPGAPGRVADPGQGPVLTPSRVEADVAEDTLKLNQLQDWLIKQKENSK